MSNPTTRHTALAAAFLTGLLGVSLAGAQPTDDTRPAGEASAVQPAPMPPSAPSAMPALPEAPAAAVPPSAASQLFGAPPATPPATAPATQAAQDWSRCLRLHRVATMAASMSDWAAMEQIAQRQQQDCAWSADMRLDAMENVADARFMRGDPVGALQAAEACVAVEPRRTGCHITRGYAFAHLQRADEAIQATRQARESLQVERDRYQVRRAETIASLQQAPAGAAGGVPGASAAAGSGAAAAAEAARGAGAAPADPSAQAEGTAPGASSPVPGAEPGSPLDARRAELEAVDAYLRKLAQLDRMIGDMEMRLPGRGTDSGGGPVDGRRGRTINI